jgi:hypothetical protein
MYMYLSYMKYIEPFSSPLEECNHRLHCAQGAARRLHCAQGAGSLTYIDIGVLNVGVPAQWHMKRFTDVVANLSLTTFPLIYVLIVPHLANPDGVAHF